MNEAKMNHNRVLIVDDDQRICRIIKRVADDLDIDSMTTDKPALFMSAYLGYEPNLILMDLQMPRLDGVELLRFLAQNDCAAAIILVSGMDKSVIETTTNLGKTLGLHMAGSLNKPIEISDVKALLEKQFEPVERSSGDELRIAEDELSQAIDQNQLVVHYQPQVFLQTGEVVGVEALVRWQHPIHGLLYPDTFIPVAENSENLISQIMEFVLEAVLRDETERQKQGANLSISVNLSAQSLSDLKLPDRIHKLLQAHHFDPQMLVLELTESAAMDDPSLTMDVLTRLRLKNIKLSIDDFGTGYSSLLHLYRLPFNEMKIDKSFVMKSLADEEAAAIVRITVELARSLGLTVVAEGIENQETYDWLNKLGCDIGQGYFISKPVDAQSFLDWLQQYNK